MFNDNRYFKIEICRSGFNLLPYKYIFKFTKKTKDKNITKGNLRYALVMYLENSLEYISKMTQNTFDEIIEKYIEMNIAHSFRGRNGRCARI